MKKEVKNVTFYSIEDLRAALQDATDARFAAVELVPQPELSQFTAAYIFARAAAPVTSKKGR